MVEDRRGLKTLHPLNLNEMDMTLADKEKRVQLKNRYFCLYDNTQLHYFSAVYPRKDGVLSLDVFA
jgi:hypothetical protein